MDIFPLVMQDLEARRQKGLETYGESLQSHNGRDALLDLHEELLDAILYLRQHREEMKTLGAELREVRDILVKNNGLSKQACLTLSERLSAVLSKIPSL